MLIKIKTYLRAHKIVSLAALVVLGGGGYWWYASANAPVAVTKYVVTAASTGTVVESVSATGQVQAGTTVNVTPQVSELVTAIPVAVGQHVSAGQVLVQLDPTNEQRAVAQDQLALQQAQLAAEETNQVATTTLLQQQGAVTTGEQALANASTSLITDYQSGFNNLGPTFVSLQTVMTGLQNFVLGNDLSRTQNDPDALVSLMPDYLQAGTMPYKNAVQASYTAAAAAYQQDLADYHAATASASTAQQDALFAETLSTAQTISDAVKAGKDFLDYVINTYPSNGSTTKPLPAIVGTLQSDFNTYTATMATEVSGVQGTITTIASDRNAIVNAENSLAQASATLAATLSGPTATTLASQQISIQTAQNNLVTAQQNLAYTSVRAPISGTVSAINAVVGETGGADAVTLIGDGQVAQVTLNEIDAAKVKLGDKATLTFDALPNVTLAGTVVEMDPVGTVSQGVVSYNVQIGFSQPAGTASSLQVKPGMSVTANIVTQVAQNVVTVPNAAITTTNGVNYVMEPSSPLSAGEMAASQNGGIVISAVKMVPVTTGAANSTMTAIVGGVNPGDEIVTQTIKSSSSGATGVAAAPGGGAFRLLGGGGAFRGGGG